MHRNLLNNKKRKLRDDDEEYTPAPETKYARNDDSENVTEMLDMTDTLTGPVTPLELPETFQTLYFDENGNDDYSALSLKVFIAEESNNVSSPTSTSAVQTADHDIFNLQDIFNIKQSLENKKFKKFGSLWDSSNTLWHSSNNELYPSARSPVPALKLSSAASPETMSDSSTKMDDLNVDFYQEDQGSAFNTFSL